MRETKLAMIRKMRGFSQSKLAKEAGVSIRVIQLAEQRQRSVDNMSGHSLWRLATALECPMESLLEHEFEPGVISKRETTD